MRRITLILPVYNDWESLRLLLNKIKKKIKKKIICDVLIINDNSHSNQIERLDKENVYKNINVINLKENIGSQKAIATGIKYISKNFSKFGKEFIILDSDGEDDYLKIVNILKLTKNNKCDVLTVNRSTRKESFVFSILYEIHLIITFLLTFKYIRYGNYSYLNSKALSLISKKSELWLAYSATLEKYFPNKKNIVASRGKRFMGQSKMNYLQLIIHSFNIQLVFSKKIIFNYLLYLTLSIIMINFSYFKFILPSLYILLLIHIISLTIVNLISSKIKFDDCLKNIKSINQLR